MQETLQLVTSKQKLRHRVLGSMRVMSRMKAKTKNVLEAGGCLAFCATLAILYAPLKLFPMKPGKLLFLSRQADAPSIDARLLFEELKRRDPSIEIVCICKRVRAGVKEKGRFLLCLAKSLYHLSTSQVCVLDSYWPAVSVLKHKRTLKIVQMWHALGKIKKSGWQTVGLPGGRSETVARSMKMHAGYDFVIAGAKAWNPFYCASFNIEECFIRNIGLPRIDYLLQCGTDLKHAVFERYPVLERGPVILYAPTFRRDGYGAAQELLSAFDYGRYRVLVESHPNQPLVTEGFPVVHCAGFSALELLPVVDYVVTDYSAIALEAAALNVKTLYYVPDYERYKTTNGLNIDLYEVMPGCVFSQPSELIKALECAYPQASLDAYRKKYLFEGVGRSTRALADVVAKEAGLACTSF